MVYQRNLVHCINCQLDVSHCDLEGESQSDVLSYRNFNRKWTFEVRWGCELFRIQIKENVSNI